MILCIKDRLAENGGGLAIYREGGTVVVDFEVGGEISEAVVDEVGWFGDYHIEGNRGGSC